jgi:hypothetical protein
MLTLTHMQQFASSTYLYTQTTMYHSRSIGRWYETSSAWPLIFQALTLPLVMARIDYLRDPIKRLFFLDQRPVDL